VFYSRYGKEAPFVVRGVCMGYADSGKTRLFRCAEARCFY